ncbi:hydrolase [Streptomyces sp. NBC_01381]|uniref:alpha/beta hydrolase family protein n=1 Tax=Streptomyces sp. NBC_01381 TaxID=2903845 RepID=UPI002257B135|nr:hydrolase [Streptomyces sp. NBC_01381]MCX4669692.1 hydrolase [Streptomyces sp. NBC_01381]
MNFSATGATQSASTRRSSALTRRSMMGLAAAGLAAAVVAAPAPAQAGSTPPPTSAGVKARLPAPTGPHEIGTFSTRLVDRSRHDPWVPSQRYRELMVSVWYPAARTSDGDHRLAPYMAPGAAERWDSMSPHGIPKGAIDFAAMRTHARERAPVDMSGGRRPVVIYASGANDPRTWGTSAVEELASRGYVVLTIDHTYEAPLVQFPDGSVKDDAPLRKALEEAQPNEMPALLKKVLDVRVADSKFVLDRIDTLPHGLSKVVDARRVGMFGQSAGGIAAAETMYEDRRVKAGIDLDGTLEYNPEPNGTNLMPVARHGLDRPFLLMGRQGSDRTTEPSWREFWSHTTAWKRNLTLRGSMHQTYTDLASLLPQAGVSQKVIEENMGKVAPARAVAAQRAYVVSFFDRWLRGDDDHLLDGPSGRYPEVEFAG